MVEICLHCGNKGFANALIYCVNCLQYAVHRYCLDKMPATFDEFVHWVCDDCEVESLEHFGSNSEPIQLENSDGKNSKHGKPNLEERSSKRKKTGNAVPDTADNLLQHQSTDDDFPRKMNTLKRIKKIKKRASESFSGSFKEKLAIFPIDKACQEYPENKLNAYVDCAKLENKHSSALKAGNKMKHEKENVESASNLSSEGPSISNLNVCTYSTELEKKNASPTDPKMEHCRHQSVDVNAKLEGNQLVEFSLLNKSNKNKRVVRTLSTNFRGRRPPKRHEFDSVHLSDNGTVHNYELALPLLDPIWRGSFNILNREYDEFDGMVAHFCGKACTKAYEEARLFPTLLDLEMHPKFDVWPKSFERSEPSDKDIALYFFPTHKRYERMFDHLVEQMMKDELAMRTILENAELLIFTSRELPLNYWRFQGKYYLWGVFRGKVGVKEEA